MESAKARRDSSEEAISDQDCNQRIYVCFVTADKITISVVDNLFNECIRSEK